MERWLRCKYKVFCLIVGVLSLVMTGCGKTDVYGTQVNGEECVYMIERTQLNIDADLLPVPSTLCIVGKDLFFLDPKANAYKMSLEQGARPERQVIFIQEEYSPITLFQSVEREPCILGMTKQGNMTIIAWDGAAFSKELATLAIPLGDEEIRKVIQATDGCFYISCGMKVIVCNQEGSLIQTIQSEHELVDIGTDNAGNVYGSCYVNDRDTMLMKINVADKRWDSNMIIPGNGKLFSAVNENCQFVDGTSIYALESADAKYSKLADLSQDGISPYAIHCMVKDGAEAYDIVTWVSYMGDSAQNPIEWIHMRKSTEEEKRRLEQDKAKIRVLTMSKGSLDAVVTEFNKNSKNSKVEVINLDYSDAKDIELFVNTRLMGKDAPDVLIMESVYYPIYKDADILLNLSGYVQESNTIKKDRFLEEVLAPFEEQDGIYALPQSFYISTLIGRNSPNGNHMPTDGMSLDDFVQMVATIPNLKMEYDGNTIGLLEMCLDLGMERFVDFEQKSCDFNGTEFRGLVERLEAIHVESGFSQTEWNEIAQGDKPILASAILSDYESYEGLKKKYGPKLDILGFPTEQEEFRTKLLPAGIIGVLKTSGEKEVAVEFLEFYLENQWPVGFPALQDKFAEAKKNQNSETIECINKAIVHSEFVNDQVLLVLKEIIFEELSFYLNGDKTLEEVLDIIQSRVSLYLLEFA